MTYDLDGLNYISKNIPVPFKARIEFMGERVVVRLEKSKAVEVANYDRQFWLGLTQERKERLLKPQIENLVAKAKAAS